MAVKSVDRDTKAETVSHVGRVLAIESRDVRVMSDVWDIEGLAVVWNGSGIERVSLGYGDWPRGRADVDATPEVVAAANEHEVERAVGEARAAYFGRIDAMVKAAKAPAKGREVVVVRGRKVPLGTVGEVFWMGNGKVYGPVPRYRGWGAWKPEVPVRVGIRTADGDTHWTDAKNVETTQPDEYMDTPPAPFDADAVAAEFRSGRRTVKRYEVASAMKRAA